MQKLSFKFSISQLSFYHIIIMVNVRGTFSKLHINK